MPEMNTGAMGLSSHLTNLVKSNYADRNRAKKEPAQKTKKRISQFSKNSNYDFEAERSVASLSDKLH